MPCDTVLFSFFAVEKPAGPVMVTAALAPQIAISRSLAVGVEIVTETLVEPFATLVGFCMIAGCAWARSGICRAVNRSKSDAASSPAANLPRNATKPTG